MSARLAESARRTHRVAAVFALAALGVFVCAFAGAQPPQEPTQPPGRTPEPKGPIEDPNQIDRRDPLPPDTPRRKALERLQIKNRDLAIFAAIEDFKPVAAQDKNPREYDAWIHFVLHAKEQHARDLDEFAIRDLVPLDLTRTMLAAYRTELIRFDGKLVCVRRLVAPPVLKDNGIAELYEARLVPVDDSPLTPVSIVFIDLPGALAAVKAKPPEEWLNVEGDTWVTASGYFFKAMSVPGERANAVVPIPVLIGKTLTPLPGVPLPPGNPTALDKNLRIYKFIKEDAKMIRNTPTEVTWPEVASFNRVILHASRFPAEELEEHAIRDLKFADLFEDTRASHKLSCVRFEGRLISLRRSEGNDWLSAAGVTQLFEGWMIPADEPRGNPICVLFSEPLAGVEPTGRVNKWVSFAGYSFKRMRYESQEQDAKTPSKNVDKYAPLLIGRAPIARPDPDGATPVSWTGFMQTVVFGGLLLLASAGLLTWWYRGGDRRAKEQMDAVRNRNPFDPNTTPPA